MLVLRETLEIKNKLGLHARAASLLVKTASGFGSEVTLICPDKQANGKSIMSVMLLQATQGSSVTVEVDGVDEGEAMACIAELIDNRFGEEE